MGNYNHAYTIKAVRLPDLSSKSPGDIWMAVKYLSCLRLFPEISLPPSND